MPTVILLDVSLSMTRRVVRQDGNEVQLSYLAREGIEHFFTQLASKCKLEFCSLIAFSSLWEIVVPFTRDYSALKDGLRAVDTYDKTCIETALSGVENLVLEELGATVPINLILVTDGCIGVGAGSLKDSLKNRSGSKQPPLPFPFPCYLSIVCLGKPSDMAANRMWYQKLIELNNGKGDIFSPDFPLSEANVQQCFNRILQSHYDRFEGTLTCGNLKSHVTLSPYPDFRSSWVDVLNLYRDKPVDLASYQMPDILPIVGFLDIADVSSPPYISRHLVVPLTKPKQKRQGSSKKAKLESPSVAEEEGKTPSFCVLLHGSLKIEKMVAISKLGENWFGMLYSWSDNKKKSSLMLSVFEPNQPIPWLGELRALGPSAEMIVNPYQYDQKEEAEDTPFPLPPSKRKSYHVQPSLVWVKNTGLQADIQKVLSHAKKLPEKQTSFFKEVNRIRRAAICYNFMDLIHHVADALERDAKGHVHEVARQLNHAAEGLRAAHKKDLSQNITPLEKSCLRI